MLFRKKKAVVASSQSVNNGNVVDIQWGGYYTSKKEGKFGIFRLLDFNKDAYHIQLFQEKFNHSPSFDVVKDLRPFVWHVPIAVGGLLNQDELKLIGHNELDEQSLMGYEGYLRQMGADEAIIKEIVNRLVEYSNKPPMKVQLTESADGVDVLPLE
jgi:hypothetical protein